MRRAKKILAITSTNGKLGFAAFEDSVLADYGVKTVYRGGTADVFSANLDRIILQLIADKNPEIVVVEVDADPRSKKAAGLKSLLALTRRMAGEGKIELQEYSRKQIRKSLSETENCPRREVARIAAGQYPELKSYFKRNKKWSDRYYQHLFEAVAAGMTYLKYRDGSN